MRKSFCSFVLITFFLCSCNEKPLQPLSLHPENPHYFLFRGKPTVLIGSTEHYGAVMNLEFDFIKYLDQISADGMNLTRTFSGVYVEPPGAFGIENNTLAPNPGKFICPWKRSNIPGYAMQGNKFDLTKWDEDYFRRLKDFVNEAGKRNIVVELDLFSNFYDTLQWKLSPLYFENNINHIGNTKNHKEILALKNQDILQIHEKMVSKIVAELKDFDNLYYEVCNEPYFGDTVALEQWENKMTDVLIDAEKGFKYKHLISQNIANKYKLIRNPHPGVSIFNFHYAKPPVTVTMNYHLNRPIGDNETGFNGTGDATYRTEAWDFLMSGGALFNNLDYSFTTVNADGTHKVKKGQPGGGGKNLRNQLRILRNFMTSIDFLHMAPDTSSLKVMSPKGCRIHSISNKFKVLETLRVFAYLNNYKPGKDQDIDDPASTNSLIKADLPAGSYEISWLNTKTGSSENSRIEKHTGGVLQITSPQFLDDLAFVITKK